MSWSQSFASKRLGKPHEIKTPEAASCHSPPSTRIQLLGGRLEGDAEPDAPSDAGWEPVSAPSGSLYAKPPDDGETRRLLTVRSSEPETVRHTAIEKMAARPAIATFIPAPKLRTNREQTAILTRNASPAAPAPSLKLMARSWLRLSSISHPPSERDAEPDAPSDAGSEPVSAPSGSLYAKPPDDGETRRRKL